MTIFPCKPVLLQGKCMTIREKYQIVIPVSRVVADKLEAAVCGLTVD